MIIATAGHVDHGKTLLVRSLTGVDTDRLAEEKRRGMTLDLGFAYADLGGRLPAGFIDVPGHERYVRTMAAGVHQVDLALLVVAADDGPMPQTREHLAMLHGLGVRELGVVLTKIDRADAAQRQRAQAGIRALLAATDAAQAPILEVDNLSGAGLPALLAWLRERQRAFDAREQPATGHARLAIDRAFHRPGAGLIVTGTLQNGQIRVNDALVLSPRGERVRVRGLRVHDQPAESAACGQRCAVNLAGGTLTAEDIGRGDWLVAPELAEATQRIDAWMITDAGLEHPLGAREQLQLHLGAACVSARLAPLAQRTLAPGEAGPVQLLLDRPVVALHADRWVLRDPAAQRILGKGLVLDPFGAPRGRSKPERLLWLDRLRGPHGQGLSPSEALTLWLEHSPQGMDIAGFCRSFNVTPESWQTLAASAGLIRIGPRALAARHAQGWGQALEDEIDQSHREAPARLGLTEPDLIARAVRRYAPGSIAALARSVARWALQQSIHAGALVREGACIRRPGHVPVLSEARQAQLDTVRMQLMQAGLRPPIAGELAERLGITREAMLAFLQEMSALGHLVPVAPNRYYLQAEVDRLAEIARELAAASSDGSFDAASYRDASGIGRNLTIEVLEFLDRQGLTRRIGQRRVLRPDH
jgi:selenocysteine-specific elongation factor